MKTYQANLLNSLTLIALSLWAYFSFEPPSEDSLVVASNTVFIPTIIGAILLVCTYGVKNENKIVAHIAVLLTFIAIVGLSMPFKAALGRDDSMAVMRVGIMIFTSALAMIIFIQSFIANRKKS
tara:strand:+ start:10175 stop:10546 length:372 start_codon:yes stop_codon:yes gene_type:complete